MSLYTMKHNTWDHALPSSIRFINGSSAVLTSSQIIVSILITHGLCDEKMIYSLMCLLMILIITKILHLTDWQVLRDQTEACNWFIVCCDCDYLSNYSCKTWQRIFVGRRLKYLIMQSCVSDCIVVLVLNELSVLIIFIQFKSSF